MIVPLKGNVKDGFAMTFVHLGRKYYQITLYANTLQNRRKWLETIHKQQEVMRLRSLVFDTVTVSEGFFTGPIRVNCAAPFGECLLLHRIMYLNAKIRSRAEDRLRN